VNATTSTTVHSFFFVIQFFLLFDTDFGIPFISEKDSYEFRNFIGLTIFCKVLQARVFISFQFRFPVSKAFGFQSFWFPKHSVSKVFGFQTEYFHHIFTPFDFYGGILCIISYRICLGPLRTIVVLICPLPFCFVLIFNRFRIIYTPSFDIFLWACALWAASDDYLVGIPSLYLITIIFKKCSVLVVFTFIFDFEGPVLPETE
jgi:hypothetical protein